MKVKKYLFFLPVVLSLSAMAGEKSPPKDLLGKGWGLDHVMIVLADPAQAKSVFDSKLGFTVAPGGKVPKLGTENAIIYFGFTYLELIWIYDPQSKLAADNERAARMREKIAVGGGTHAYFIDASPIKGAVDILAALGIKLALPSTPDYVSGGRTAHYEWQMGMIENGAAETSAPGIPGGVAANFIEYNHNEDRADPKNWKKYVAIASAAAPDARRHAGEVHPNTARELDSVWVSVKNLDEALNQSRRLGFPTGAERHSELLGARGREVQCGKGKIVFWEPEGDASLLTKNVKKQGYGPFGFGVRVDDLERARELVSQGTGHEVQISQGAFVIPPELAAGNWIEFSGSGPKTKI